MGCVYNINLENQPLYFNSEKDLNDFIENNKDKIALSLQGLGYDINFSIGSDPIGSVSSKIITLSNKASKLANFNYSNDIGLDKDTIGKEGYLGVSKAIDAATRSDGRKIVPDFRREAYIENRLKKELELKAEGHDGAVTNFLSESWKTEIMNEINQDLDNWGKLGDIGTKIHAISEHFFNGEDASVIESDTLTREEVDLFYGKLQLMKERLERKHGAGSKFMPEVKIMDEKSKLVGIVDLVVIDADGLSHIYDFKTSYKETKDWSKEKRRKYMYQLGYYKNMLESNDIKVDTLGVIPIEMTGIDYDNETVESLVFDDIDFVSYEDFYNNKVKPYVDSVVKVNRINKIKEHNTSKIDSIMSEAFNINPNSTNYGNVKTFKKTAKSLVQQEDGSWSYYDVVNEGYVDNVSEEDLDSEIEKYLNRLNQNQDRFVNKVLDGIERRKEGGDTKFEKNSFKSNMNNVFSKYFNDDNWEYSENEELKKSGIAVFYNHVLNTVDVACITPLNTDAKVELDVGTSILGNTRTNNSLRNEDGVLNSTFGNILLMKALIYINEHNDDFKDVKIGEIFAVNMNYENSTKKRSKQVLENNFRLLAKEKGLTNNYKDLNHMPEKDLILYQINALIESNELNKSESSEWKGFYDNFSAAESKKDVLKLLFKKFQEVNRTNRDPRAYRGIKEYLARGINYYQNLPMYFEEDVKQWSLTGGSNLGNPDTIHHEAIKSMQGYFKNITNELNSGYAKIKLKDEKEINAFFKSKNFGSFSQLTTRSSIGQFKHLFETEPGDDSKINKRFRLRRDLTGSDARFVNYFLKRINDIRYNGDINLIQEAMDNGSYYDVPIMKISPDSAFASRGNNFFTRSGAYLKEKWKQHFNFDGLFEDDFEQFRKRNNDFSEFVNYYSKYNEPDARAEKIAEVGVGGLEIDLEFILDSYTAASMKEKAYYPALQTFNSMRLLLELNKTNMLGDFTNLEKYFKEEVQSKIFGQQLVPLELDAKKKIIDTMKYASSLFTIGLSPLSGAKDLTQGFLNNASRLGIKHDIPFKTLARAYGEVLSKSATEGNITKFEAMSAEYQLASMDMRMIKNRMRGRKRPLLSSDTMFVFNVLPDKKNREALMVAKMMKDGCYKAHRIEDNELIYDMSKDDRYNVYLEGLTNPSVKNTELWKKQYGLYLANLSKFAEEGFTNPDGSPLKNGDMLPRAYTRDEGYSIKSIADSIHGYYNEEDRVKAEKYFLGSIFFQFKTWLPARLAQYWQKRGTYHRGEWKQIKDSETDELIFLTEEGQPTTEDTGIPAMEWKGIMMEGIFQSYGGFIKDLKERGGNLRETLEFLRENDPQRLANMKLGIRDLIITAIVAILVGAIDWDDLKKDDPVPTNFARAIIRGGDDFYLGNNIGAVITSQNPFPSISYLTNFGDNFGKVLLGDKDFSAFATGQVGLLRSTEGLINIE